jgi:hypothetical protein
LSDADVKTKNVLGCWVHFLTPQHNTRLTMAKTDLETCANCDRVIGRLETCHLWQNQTVCAECLAKLQKTDEAPPPSDIADQIDRELNELDHQRGTFESAVVKPSRRQLLPGQMICINPNCGWIGTPERKSRGSAIVMILLLLIAVLPGLIYIIFMSGYDYFCPRCGCKLKTEHR